MPQAEARAWWADVQHLNPDAPGPTSVVAGTEPPESPAAGAGDELAERRRGRITGKLLSETAEPRLRRSDASAFADALSLDEPVARRVQVTTEDENDRRMIHITGTPDPVPVRRLHEVQQRREHGAAERMSSRPDRIALWAVALGIFLVLLAAVSSSADAAVLLPH